MYDVKIYGRTGCPHCFFAERKMQDVKDAMVTVIHDNQQVKDVAKEHNTDELPIVMIDGAYYNFLQAKEWVEKHI